MSLAHADCWYTSHQNDCFKTEIWPGHTSTHPHRHTESCSGAESSPQYSQSHLVQGLPTPRSSSSSHSCSSRSHNSCRSLCPPCSLLLSLCKCSCSRLSRSSRCILLPFFPILSVLSASFFQESHSCLSWTCPLFLRTTGPSFNAFRTVVISRRFRGTLHSYSPP